MLRIRSVRCVEGFTVELGLSDGTQKQIDLEPYLNGPIFEPLRDPGFFQQIRVDDELGTIVWPNGADICPDVSWCTTEPQLLSKTRPAAGRPDERWSASSKLDQGKLVHSTNGKTDSLDHLNATLARLSSFA